MKSRRIFAAALACAALQLVLPVFAPVLSPVRGPLALLLTAPVYAQSPSSADSADEGGMAVTRDSVQVTATRLPEDVEVVPVSITVVSGEEIRDRGAVDLSQALAMIAGVTVAPGGEGGPASAVPELWGLREADAYLLVVDGVPRGGAFNPDPATVDLAGVERIEVLRGAAPVLFGATSFVGVIHVIHYAPGEGPRTAFVAGADPSSGAVSVSLPLAGGGTTGYRHGLTAGYEDRGFDDERAGYRKGHVLYRAAVGDRDAGGAWSFDLEGTALEQDPQSPRPRTGRVLSPLVPVDANHNPRGAMLDQDRLQLTGRYDRGAWSSTLSAAQSKVDTLRGFLSSVSSTPENARGYEQEREVTDLYFDTHYVWEPTEAWKVIAGFDHLYGRGEAESENFAYSVNLDGSGAPALSSVRYLEEVEFEDERNFSGLYLQAAWTPQPRWRVELGARVNRTVEDREAEAEPIGEEEPGEEEEEGFSDSLDVTRGSGFAGVSFLVSTHPDRPLWAFANYRNTYKPGAIDFGPEAEGGILDPETAESWEAGVKGGVGTGFDWRLSAFRMDFSNLVLPASVNGLPTLVNAGEERFEGVEAEVELRPMADLLVRGGASWHDATFRNYTRLFDGVPFVLDGNRLELSAQQLASVGVIWSPATGLRADALAEYVGSRFLDKRNRSEADAFTVLSAGVGYRFGAADPVTGRGGWEVRLDGRNLTDEREPVTESELGDAQYYLLPGRRVQLSLRHSW